MQYLYKFNFKEFNEDILLNAYLEYKISTSNILQKDLVVKLGVTQSLFTRAKKSGYTNNITVYKALKEYFNIKNPNLELLSELENLHSELYNYIYYCNSEKQHLCYLKFIDLYSKVKNTDLEILVLMGISMSVNVELYHEDITILDENKEKLEYFVKFFTPTNKCLGYYSLYEYALHKKDLKLAIYYGKQVEPLVSELPLEFEVFMDYLMMNYSYFKQDFLQGITYATKVINYQNKYFSYPLRTTAVYTLIVFYYTLKNYDKVIEVAKSEIVTLQFDETHQLQYFSILSALASAYMQKCNYEKALELNNSIYDYNFDEHKSISKEYVPRLSAKKTTALINNLFIYYKLDNKDLFNDTYKQIDSYNNDKLSLYAKIIKYIYNNTLADFKKADSLLSEESKNNMVLGFTDIHYTLINELKSKDFMNSFV